MTEISDKLWMAVDYQSGRNATAQFQLRGFWNFAKNVSVIFGYDIWTDRLWPGTTPLRPNSTSTFPNLTGYRADEATAYLSIEK